MSIDWEDKSLGQCPSAITARVALQCDGERERMRAEGKRLAAEVKWLQLAVEHWAGEAKRLSAQLVDALEGE